MLCYITHDVYMLYKTCYVKLHNTGYVMLYDTSCVCYITHVML